MTKPAIFWSGRTNDGIFASFRDAMTDRGYPQGNEDAMIVAFSAGDPFWKAQNHDENLFRAILADMRRRVVIVERHEYGWANYENPNLRAQNAWLGAHHYGRDTDVAGGKWGDLHEPIATFVRKLADQRVFGRKFVYLRREFFADYPYPEFVHPCSFKVDVKPDLPSFEEWIARPFDVVCVWGETHPHRKVIADAVRDAAARGLFKAEVRSPVYHGDQKRLPDHVAFRDFHRCGRIFIESDGHGLGGGRMWELSTTLAMFRKRSHMVLRHDFIDGQSCVDFGTPNDPCVDSMIAKLCDWIARPRDLYDLFRRAHGHAWAWHSGPAQAEYLEAVMHKHGFFS